MGSRFVYKVKLLLLNDNYADYSRVTLLFARAFSAIKLISINSVHLRKIRFSWKLPVRLTFHCRVQNEVNSLKLVEMLMPNLTQFTFAWFLGHFWAKGVCIDHEYNRKIE